MSPDPAPLLPAGEWDPADPVLELARAIRPDVAHELRGPVQSVVVNMEVARRRLADGDTAGAAERFDLIETEVRRLHTVADAFLSLLRPLPEQRSVFDAATVLAPIEALVQVLARSARVRYRTAPDEPGPLVRSRPEALALAFVRILATLNTACGPQGEVRVEKRTTPGSLDLIVRAVPGAAGGAPDSDAGIERAIDAANRWLQPDGGTVERLSGSDLVALRLIRIRLPRADMA